MNMKKLNIPRNWKTIALAVIFVFLSIYPALGPSSYIKHLFILFFIWAVVAINWNLLIGYTGISSLAGIGFLAIGAYTSGILSKYFPISPWITIFIAGAFTAFLVTIFLGFPALRLSGIYITLLTLIFADTLPSILSQTRGVTGGAMGLHGVPEFFDHATKTQNYYVCFVFFLIVLYIIYRVVNSSTGLAFVALRDHENFAHSLGVDKFRERIKVFALSSFLTGMAGGVYIHVLGDISPATLSIEPFLLTVAMVELGGVGTLFGPVIGAFVIIFGNEYLRLAGTFRLALLGALICLAVLFFPGGLMQLIEKLEQSLPKWWTALRGRFVASKE
jgi:branched-chain amino acid transport system permease protein